MLSLKTALTNIANWIKGVDDYIVEHGTKSGWTYRRWKSNLIEMWYSGSSIGSTQSWNGGYGITLTINAPFATTNGRAFFTAQASSGFGMPGQSFAWETSRTAIPIATWGSQNGRVYYNVYVIGTWGSN